MNAQIVCIGCGTARWREWEEDMEADGYVVVHASDETEAVELLKGSRVEVICIDSRAFVEAGRSAIGASLKNTDPHVPVVLMVQTGSKTPPHCEEHVDVIIDESTFAAMGHWLIEELREARFPMFLDWFEEWKQRRPSGNS
jgi:DNA-binding NarL/FixJ family response regulator